ncbi:hypothetical protein [Streptomyces montanus]|nr:hypothetical protein [Streptomyces montanus]
MVTRLGRLESLLGGRLDEIDYGALHGRSSRSGDWVTLHSNAA